MNPQPKPLRKYHKDQREEHELAETNSLLAQVNDKLHPGLDAPSLPTVFVLGTQRSGHTLVGQLLITRFRFAYPSNFIARFWRAPGIGARLQRLIIDRNLESRSREDIYRSEHGATKGAYGLHEFGYFWSEVFRFGETHVLSDDELRRVDKAKLRRDVALLEAESGKLPTLFKNGTLGFQASFLADVFPLSVFVYCRRGLLWVAQSTLEMRLNRFGSKDRWFSFRPKEYPQLLKRPYHEQIAGQVVYVRRHVEAELAAIEASRGFIVDYENACRDPRGVIAMIGNWLGNRGCVFDILGEIPDSFVCRNEQRIHDEDFRLLQEALNSYGCGSG